MPFIIFFSLLRRCSHSALVCSRQERLRQLPEQVFLSLCAGCVAAGDKDVCPPLLPQAPGKKLGEGRWAVNDLGLGMGITQVVTGRGEAPQPPSAARNQLGQHRAVDFQALWYKIQPTAEDCVMPTKALHPCRAAASPQKCCGGDGAAHQGPASVLALSGAGAVSGHAGSHPAPFSRLCRTPGMGAPPPPSLTPRSPLGLSWSPRSPR